MVRPSLAQPSKNFRIQTKDIFSYISICGLHVWPVETVNVAVFRCNPPDNVFRLRDNVGNA